MNIQGAYNVDIVMVLDKTGSMTDIMETVKNNALTLRRKIELELEDGARGGIATLRVRVVAFGCIGEDRSNSFRVSDFFELPDDEKAFEAFVAGIAAEGGGEESGLNALAVALQSDWLDLGRKTRHIVLMFTDEDSHPLEKHYGSPYCPANAPRNMAELSDLWYGQKISQRGKRLVIVGPTNSVYDRQIVRNWDRTQFVAIERDEQSLDIDGIVRLIGATISSQ